VSSLDEMWTRLEAHKPEPKYAKAWRKMCAERTTEAAEAAAEAAAAWAAEAAWAAWAARAAASASWAADAIKNIAKAEGK